IILSGTIATTVFVNLSSANSNTLETPGTSAVCPDALTVRVSLQPFCIFLYADLTPALQKTYIFPNKKLDTRPVHKTYHSPWEQVILSDPHLAESLQLRMPEPEPRQELPEYKCFNRVATPYGGFEKAPRGITFKLPEVDLNPPQYQELSDPQAKRPTFNRTAQGWISEGTHLILPTITLESFSVPESDDL
uniref:Myozenin 2b n=1 Tax=Xiphophorus couchianus TaxID=32473 RepID=A0A3B5LBS9_9TELE